MLSTLYRFVSLPRNETTVKYHKGLSVLMRQMLLLAVESPLTARDSSSREQGGHCLWMPEILSVNDRFRSWLELWNFVLFGWLLFCFLSPPFFFIFCKGNLLDLARILQLDKFVLWNFMAPIQNFFPYSSNWHTQLKSSCIGRLGGPGLGHSVLVSLVLFYFIF